MAIKGVSRGDARLAKLAWQRRLPRVLRIAVLGLAACGALPSVAIAGFGPPAGPTSPPFTQCPAIGDDTSCGFLIDVTGAQQTQTLYQDSSQGPYEGSDDVLVAVQNDSSAPLSSINLGVSGSGDGEFGFDGDGLCTQTPAPSDCPFGPAGSSGDPFDYYGPGMDFNGGSDTTTDPDAGTVDFQPPLQSGQYTYFTLEEPPTQAIVLGNGNDYVDTTLSDGDFSEKTISEQSPTDVTDTAVVYGPHGASGDDTATGTVTFRLYTDPKCQNELQGPGGQPAGGTSQLSAGQSSATSSPVGAALPTNSVYYWQASYNGDGSNSPAVSPCGSETMTFGTPGQPVNLTVSLAGAGQGSVAGNGINCPTTCSAGYSPGSAVTLTVAPASGSVFAGWSGGGCTGTGGCTVTMNDAQTVTATFNRGLAPVSTAPPVITGTTKSGHPLVCSTGSWMNNPTIFAFSWNRNGTVLAGLSGDTYNLGTLDEGTTLVCTVTAANAFGSAAASSSPVQIPIPFVPRCPGATGRISGQTIGLIHLGMTRAEARLAYIHHSDRGKQYEDFFCLTPIGVRVGYASPKLLQFLSHGERANLQGRVVWSSTSNPYYALFGVRPGDSIDDAAARLGVTSVFHIGLNYWYLGRKPNLTAVLKVRHGVVEELGIADNSLTSTRQSQSILMHSFY